MAKPESNGSMPTKAERNSSTKESIVMATPNGLNCVMASVLQLCGTKTLRTLGKIRGRGRLPAPVWVEPGFAQFCICTLSSAACQVHGVETPSC